MDIIEATRDPELFAPWFKNVESWRYWFVYLKAVFGIEMDDDERAVFTECTGCSEPPSEGVREAWTIVGRRGGKSLIMAVIAAYLAALIDWSPHLTPGERGTVMIIAADRKQARTIFRYVTALLKETILAELIERETADTIDLTNGITIEILTASFRTVRGYSLVACLADEIAFWRSDESGANPDKEIIGAIRPAMATIPGAMLLCGSSPYARRGVLWDAYRRHYGKDSSVLVWKAATRTMNPSVPQSYIDEATEADPASAGAEYGAEFRSDVETLISREAVDACTVAGRRELPPCNGETYFAFVDPSGGSADSMTLAIAHKDKWTEAVVLDAIREVRPPFSPEDVVSEFIGLLKTYGITTVRGDRYAGEWPRERFRVHGVRYEPSVKVKGDLYRDLLPLLNSGRAELLEHPKLQSQLLGLERRTARGGRDSIDHGPGGHDDIANAVAGALLMAAEGYRERRLLFGSVKVGPSADELANYLC